MKTALTLLICAAALAAQDKPKNPVTASSQALFGIAKNDILRSAEKVPEELWSFKPTPEVRSMGQLFAHVADGQYEFCGAASEGKPIDKGIEKSADGKAQIVAALKDAFAYCDAAYAKMNDGTASEMVGFFGRQLARVAVMDFNTAHTMEHYGNLVTYMRLKKIVPPSSERSQ